LNKSLAKASNLDEGRMFPFAYLAGLNQPATDRVIEISEERLRALLTPLIELIHVDEGWYCSQYPDVADAISSGKVSSARDHYRISGYYEDRLPRAVSVDEQWYLTEYPDVAEAVATGRIYSGQHHFMTSGFQEGRRASDQWSLISVKNNRPKV
jgi:hypothetical protein